MSYPSYRCHQDVMAIICESRPDLVHRIVRNDRSLLPLARELLTDADFRADVAQAARRLP